MAPLKQSLVQFQLQRENTRPVITSHLCTSWSLISTPHTWSLMASQCECEFVCVSYHTSEVQGLRWSRRKWRVRSDPPIVNGLWRKSETNSLHFKPSSKWMKAWRRDRRRRRSEEEATKGRKKRVEVKEEKEGWVVERRGGNSENKWKEERGKDLIGE